MSICIIKWFESDQLFLWFRYETFGRIDFAWWSRHWTALHTTPNTKEASSSGGAKVATPYAVLRTLSSALFSLFPRPATCKSWLFEKRLTFYISVWWSLFFPVRHPHRLAPGFSFVCHHKWLSCFVHGQLVDVVDVAVVVEFRIVSNILRWHKIDWTSWWLDSLRKHQMFPAWITACRELHMANKFITKKQVFFMSSGCTGQNVRNHTHSPLKVNSSNWIIAVDPSQKRHTRTLHITGTQPIPCEIHEKSWILPLVASDPKKFS